MKVIALLMVACVQFLNAMELEQKKAFEVRMSAYSSQGKRDCQEDCSVTKILKYGANDFFGTGVFDGHAGACVAQYLKKDFFSNYFDGLNEGKSVEASLIGACGAAEYEMCEGAYIANVAYSGSTLLASCFDSSTNKLHMIWVGDSCAYFGNNKEFRVTQQHRLTDEDEKKRIEEAGGTIDQCEIVGGILLSRSIGYAHAKKNYLPVGSVIATPDYCECDFDNSEYGYYIGATDGFSDVVEPAEFMDLFFDAAQLVQKDFNAKYLLNSSYESGSSSDSSTDGHETSTDTDGSFEEDSTYESSSEDSDELARFIAKRLVRIAKSRGATDNITVVVQLFGAIDWLGPIRNSKSVLEHSELDAALTALNSIPGQPAVIEQSATTHVDAVALTPTEQVEVVSPDQQEIALALEENKTTEPTTSILQSPAKEVPATQLTTAQPFNKSVTPSAWRRVSPYIIAGGLTAALVAVLIGYYYKQLSMNYPVL